MGYVLSSSLVYNPSYHRRSHKDYLFQKRLAHRLPMDSFRFDFRYDVCYMHDIMYNRVPHQR
jgi:hypothetical protein